MPRAVISTEKPAEGRPDRIVLVVTRQSRDKPGEPYTRKQFFSYDEAADAYKVLGKALLAAGRTLPQVTAVPRPPQDRP